MPNSPTATPELPAGAKLHLADLPAAQQRALEQLARTDWTFTGADHAAACPQPVPVPGQVHPADPAHADRRVASGRSLLESPPGALCWAPATVQVRLGRSTGSDGAVGIAWKRGRGNAGSRGRFQLDATDPPRQQQRHAQRKRSRPSSLRVLRRPVRGRAGLQRAAGRGGAGGKRKRSALAHHAGHITLGFTDESSRGGAAVMASKPRRYKRFEIDAETGEVKAMKIRSVEHA